MDVPLDAGRQDVLPVKTNASRVAGRYVRRVASGTGLFSDKFGPSYETAMSAVYGYLNKKAKEATADIFHALWMKMEPKLVYVSARQLKGPDPFYEAVGILSGTRGTPSDPSVSLKFKHWAERDLWTVVADVRWPKGGKQELVGGLGVEDVAEKIAELMITWGVAQRRM